MAETCHAGLANVVTTYRFWGRHPLLYAAQDYVTFLGRPRMVRAAAVMALECGPGDRVLEVGCGTGRNLPYLVRTVGRLGRVVGFDYSTEMLGAAARLAQARGWYQVEFAEGDAAELPVAGSFDGVLSVLAMSAIPDWQTALRRCYEVLRPGGRLAICDARTPPWGGPALNALIAAVYARWAAWQPGRELPGAIERLFGNVRAQSLNAGTFYIATAVKEGFHS